MKIRRSKLRRIIREACSLAANDTEHSAMHHDGASDEVPSPGDYQVARAFMEGNPELVDLGISMVMDMAGTSCEKSTAQAIIDHLRNLVSGTLHPSLDSHIDNQVLKLDLGV